MDKLIGWIFLIVGLVYILNILFSFGKIASWFLGIGLLLSGFLYLIKKDSF